MFQFVLICTGKQFSYKHECTRVEVTMIDYWQQNVFVYSLSRYKLFFRTVGLLLQYVGT